MCDPVFLHPHQHLRSLFFFILSVWWHLIVALVCISLTADDVEHLSMCHLYIFVSEMSAHIFCPFSNWSSSLLSVKSSLYSLDTSPLAGMCLVNIFSQLQFVFSSSSKGLPRKKNFNFDEVKFINFSLYGSCYWCEVKKFLPSPISQRFSPVLFSKSFIVYIVHISPWFILS